MPRAAKSFFIPMVHSPLGVVGHVAAPKLPLWGGRARSYGTRDSAKTHLDRQPRSGAEGHVAASELTSARRKGSGPWDTWQRRIPPQLGGEVWSYRIRCSAWMHAFSLSWLKSCMQGYPVCRIPTSMHQGIWLCMSLVTSSITKQNDKGSEPTLDTVLY
jgi:hypothetical protein